jgi:hypothetical protein
VGSRRRGVSPVQVQGAGTRVDFVLESYQGQVWLLCECKNVSEKHSDWLFVPNESRGHYYENRTLVEKLYLRGPVHAIAAHLDVGFTPTRCSIGIDVKTDESKDGRNKRRSGEAVEDAATQVCKGLNGMVDFLSANPRLLEVGKPKYLVPVIFTTAHLWVSREGLSAADLGTGKLPAPMHVDEVESLVYQARISPNLKHAVEPYEQNPRSLRGILAASATRSIFIVNARGIEKFMALLAPGLVQEEPIELE